MVSWRGGCGGDCEAAGGGESQVPSKNEFEVPVGGVVRLGVVKGDVDLFIEHPSGLKKGDCLTLLKDGGWCGWRVIAVNGAVRDVKREGKAWVSDPVVNFLPFRDWVQSAVDCLRPSLDLGRLVIAGDKFRQSAEPLELVLRTFFGGELTTWVGSDDFLARASERIEREGAGAACSGSASTAPSPDSSGVECEDRPGLGFDAAAASRVSKDDVLRLAEFYADALKQMRGVVDQLVVLLMNEQSERLIKVGRVEEGVVEPASTTLSTPTSTAPADRPPLNLPLKLVSGTWDITESKRGIQVRGSEIGGGHLSYILYDPGNGKMLRSNGVWWHADPEYRYSTESFPTLESAVRGWREAGGE